MYDLLSGLRVVEAASFVAGPSAGMQLAHMGAEVIRIDQIGGGPDFHRWPLAPGGSSLYWEGLNKGKKSIAIDLTRPEGRELAVALASAPAFDRDEGARFTHRARLFALVEPALRMRDAAEVGRAFDATGVTWAAYRSLFDASSDARLFGAPIVVEGNTGRALRCDGQVAMKARFEPA